MEGSTNAAAISRTISYKQNNKSFCHFYPPSEVCEPVPSGGEQGSNRSHKTLMQNAIFLRIIQELIGEKSDNFGIPLEQTRLV